MQIHEFESKLVKLSCSCWIWLGSTRGAGYAQVSACHEPTRMANRLSLRLYCAVEVPPYKIVIHTCDTPQCVNPQHLRIGTHIENSADMVRKRRYNHPPNRHYNTEVARQALAKCYEDPEFRKLQGIKISNGLRRP